MAVLEQSWVKVQEKTFGKWCVRRGMAWLGKQDIWLTVDLR
jgi:hypothetical protein